MENVYNLVFEFWNTLIGGIEFFDTAFINSLSVITIILLIVGIYLFMRAFFRLITGGKKSWF